jgi:hypothetical protein
MRDYLIDIVSHTLPLGVLDLIKVTGDDKSTVLDSISNKENSVILRATFNTPSVEFEGLFGMPNISKLHTILNIPEYKENATITVKPRIKDNVSEPGSFHFVNGSNDFQNEYRLMSGNLINSKVPPTKFSGANWNVTLEPTQAAIMRLKFQAQANSDEDYFIAKTENGDLKFYFGNHSTHAGNFVFQHGVTGALSKGWSWPVAVVQAILNLDGDKLMQFSDDGIAQITVNSGLITYEYIIPGNTK